MELTLALIALALVLAFAMFRPRGWPEAVAAVPAAASLIALGVVSLDEAGAEIEELLPVVAFLAAVVLLTPVVLATARTLNVPSRPHAYATAHLANTASLLLPVSNLTNLLAFSAAGLTFAHFSAVMSVPWVLAIAAEYVLLRLVFRHELRDTPQPTEPPPPADLPMFVLVVLGCTLVGFAGTSLLGVAPASAALAGAVVLGVRGLVRGRSTVTGIVLSANVPFLAFVLCLGVVVTAVMNHGLDTAMGDVLPTGTTLPALLGIAVVAALLAGVVNNLPAVLVLLPLVAGAGPAAVLAVLIGVNVGPNLTYPGSLSNLLWRSVVHREGLAAGFGEFSLIGLITVPVTLVAGVLGLWAGIQLFGV